MVGRTPANIIAVRPLRDGVISDFDVTEQMIKYFVDQGPRPGRADPAAADAARHSVGRHRGGEARRSRRGAQRRCPLGPPHRGAHGRSDRRRPARRRADREPDRGHRRWHHGGRGHQPRAASSSAAASASGATRWTRTSSPTAGASTTCSSASGPPRTSRSPSVRRTPVPMDAQRVTLRGRDLLTGLPRAVEISADQIREAIELSVQQIVDTIKDTIEETPPELVADIMDQGIVLAGGGALLAGSRPARCGGDADAGPHRGRPADLRRAGYGPRARGTGRRMDRVARRRDATPARPAERGRPPSGSDDLDPCQPDASPAWAGLRRPPRGQQPARWPSRRTRPCARSRTA